MLQNCNVKLKGVCGKRLILLVFVGFRSKSFTVKDLERSDQSYLLFYVCFLLEKGNKAIYKLW